MFVVSRNVLDMLCVYASASVTLVRNKLQPDINCVVPCFLHAYSSLNPGLVATLHFALRADENAAVCIAWLEDFPTGPFAVGGRTRPILHSERTIWHTAFLQTTVFVQGDGLSCGRLHLIQGRAHVGRTAPWADLSAN